MLNFLETNKDITQLSNFKTRASAQFFYELKNESDIDNLKQIHDFAKMQNLEVLIIWGGTNMLFAFDIFEGIVIKNSLSGWTYDKETKKLISYSNEMIREIAESLEIDNGQDLWHRFIGLPGSLGGAIFWNAWCFWLETENNFMSADVIDLTSGQRMTLKKADMNFWYRSSILKDNEWKYFLMSAEFDLSEKIEKYHNDVDNIFFREHKQPNGNSCGSFFKNPDRENSAWFLIEQVWLKWYKIWGAFFSEKHANFLMHDWQWKWQDLVELLELAMQKVKNQFWIKLVNEVRIIRNMCR